MIFFKHKDHRVLFISILRKTFAFQPLQQDNTINYIGRSRETQNIFEIVKSLISLGGRQLLLYPIVSWVI